MDVGLEDVEDILLVEDNPADVRLVEEAFHASSFDPTIRTSRTRDEALDQLSRRGEHEGESAPDLVLLDWNLSQHTGEAVIEAAKSCDPPIPVVVMTGSKSELVRVESSVSAADGYIEKPADPHGYIDVLRSCRAE